MLSPGTAAVLMGIVHGLGEFLPISGAGHLALAAILFKVRCEPNVLFLLHGATLLAPLLAIGPVALRLLEDGARALVHPARFTSTPGGRDALVVLFACAPSALLGLTLHAPGVRSASSPLALGLAFLGTTLVLSLARFAEPGDREQPTLRGAVLLGVAQGLAVLPGFSRSGATITVALLLGVRPVRAFELSLLVSLPMLLGSLIFEARGPRVLEAPDPGAVLVVLAALAAGITGARLLRVLVEKGSVSAFAFWVGPLALATMTMGFAWPG